MKIIPGKLIAEKINIDLKRDIMQSGTKPLLKIYYIGDDPASAKYIEKKVNKGKEVGVDVIVEKFPNDTDLTKLSEILINDGIDSSIKGMIIQLPVQHPGAGTRGSEDIGINELFKLIPVCKDVDGLNPLSLGLLWHEDKYVLIPATVKAILKSLEYVAGELKMSLKEFLEGKNCLVINRSLIIGKPVSAVLVNNDATVTIAHSKTKNIQDLISKSEIIISATGNLGFLNSFQFSPNTVIIDSGFSLLDGNVCGDVIRDTNFGENISYLSPVPGGIGPIGVACLLENTYSASKISSNNQ